MLIAVDEISILQNRQSLELENRIGARADVDEVDILSIKKVKRVEKGGVIAEAEWVVGGSVSHFGHRHYRRNQYHARVMFLNDKGFWKIRQIELIDEKRLL
jgi:hypothetical protein